MIKWGELILIPWGKCHMGALCLYIKVQDSHSLKFQPKFEMDGKVGVISTRIRSIKCYID